MNGYLAVLIAGRLSFSFAAFMTNDIATTDNAWIFRHNGLTGEKF